MGMSRGPTITIGGSWQLDLHSTAINTTFAGAVNKGRIYLYGNITARSNARRRNFSNDNGGNGRRILDHGAFEVLDEGLDGELVLTRCHRMLRNTRSTSATITIVNDKTLGC